MFFRVSRELDNIDSNDINELELFLNKYRNVLHPTHFISLGVKVSLSQLYGKIDGYLIHELNDELLLRKKHLCEEILKVFDVIEPGYTRIRGKENIIAISRDLIKKTKSLLKSLNNVGSSEMSFFCFN